MDIKKIGQFSGLGSAADEVLDACIRVRGGIPISPRSLKTIESIDSIFTQIIQNETNFSITNFDRSAYNRSLNFKEVFKECGFPENDFIAKISYLRDETAKLTREELNESEVQALAQDWSLIAGITLSLAYQATGRH